MIKFEYVASGMAHLRFNSPKFLDESDKNGQETINIIRKFVSKINTEENKFSILFNGYTERRLGEIISNKLSDITNDIYSDSGGLQVVTTGAKLTNEIKNNVYKTQAEFSSIGMSFDEIPVVIQGETSTRNDMTTRYFDPDILIEKARQSGKNLLEQINYFIDCKTKTKPMIILQGNNFETYKIWLEEICNVVGLDKLKYIKGIASGAAALGQKPLEDVERMFILCQLQYPKELSSYHIHMLGVGSQSRLFPIKSMLKANLLNEEKLISYDSTTHTSALSLGNYYYDQKLLDVSRKNKKNTMLILDVINANLQKMELDTISYKQMNDFVLNPSIFNSDEYCKDNDMLQRHYTIWAYFSTQIVNFSNDLNKMITSDKYYYNLLHKADQYIPYKAVERVRDVKDFYQWKNEFGYMLPSNRVISKNELKQNNLEELF